MATIQGVYIALFGRPADPTGLAYFNGVTNNGADLTAIGDLASTAEYQARFKDKTNLEIVTTIYQSLFGRDPEAAGLEFFANALTTGTFNINNIAIAILDGAQGDDKTVLANKEKAADAFTAALDTGTEKAAYTGTAAAAKGVTFLSTITKDESSIPSAAATAAAITDIVGSASAGATLALTAGADKVGASETLASTAQNDTINGAVDDGWDSADTIDGGLGTDTLTATITKGVTVAKDTGLVGVENVFVTTKTNAATVDVANASGLSQVWNNAGAKALTVTGLAAGVTVGLKGAVADKSTFTLKDDSGTADAITIALDGTSGGKETVVANIETVTIANTGSSAADAGKITADKAGTVSVTGSSNTTVDLDAVVATSFDASGATGDVVADLDTSTKLQTVKSGTGDDNLTLTTGAASKAVTVESGSGNDTVVLTAGQFDKTVTVTGGDGADKLQANLGNIKDATKVAESLVTFSDFTKGSDVLAMTSGSAEANLDTNQLADIANDASLQIATAKAASFIAAGQYAAFIYGGDAYVFDDISGNGTVDAGDGLIKISGVTDLADLGSAFVA